MTTIEQPRPLGSAIIRFWQRIPVVIQAIVLGSFVFAIVGSVARIVILALVPASWSVVAMGGVLWVYWKYFSGSWWPKSTAEARSSSFRRTELSTDVWKWSLIAAMLVVVVIESGIVITFRILEFPAEAWTSGYDFNAVSPWLAWLLIAMAAMIAGITEEVGFRGYMQVPLEKRYGAVVGLTIVSTVFVVFHLNQAWAPPVLLLLFAASMMWGILAYASDSLIPGMISHTVGDVFSFSYWWTDVAGTFDKRPIAETGIDSHFVVWVLVFVASVALFSWTAHKTMAARRQT